MILTPSPNCDDRPADTPIDMLVLHYTGMPSGAAALERLRDPAAQVSAHYLIEEDGRVFALVAEDRRAWHAGMASWRGHTNINARSIGIELVNPGHEFGYRRFPAAQMAALAELAHGILSRHPIPARNVVGHADIAPQRKADPGELFNWTELAAQGIGHWPQDALPTPRPFQTPPLRGMLARWGYDTSTAAATRAAVVAFQRHYRPSRHDGVEDHESAVLLAKLLDSVGRLF